MLRAGARGSHLLSSVLSQGHTASSIHCALTDNFKDEEDSQGRNNIVPIIQFLLHLLHFLSLLSVHKHLFLALPCSLVSRGPTLVDLVSCRH